MNARDSILAGLRAGATVAPAAAPDLEPWYASGVRSLEERVAEFAQRLTAQHAQVLVETAESWAHGVACLLASGPPRRLLVDRGCTKHAALLAALGPGTEAVEFARPIEAWKRELFDTIDAGFSVASAGIAALGALAFASGPGAARCTSLVPPLHIAWIDARTIHPDLLTACRAEGWAGSLPTNLVMVSGPSKTSDIQLTTAYGAHGPGRLVVVIVRAGTRP